jgi:hypothetical protein
MSEALNRASGPTLAEANAILAGALAAARADGLPPVAVV